ncbi:uncharacterized protein LOC115984328 isoform X2 [Quercus lobata]|uniref:uncharacterized protein LOC115984328 isoform X2 n=1 Tax=Quercus lobata TaxID=97700 RepID=UPI00124419DC|nr:uncharacterized protein LOC115984328 isoform X2 [Quercus lobata]
MFLPFHMQIREVKERFQICLYKDCSARVFSLLKISSMLQVGTVLNVEDAINAINAGAKFLISPAVVKDIMVDAQCGEVLYIPRVMTPTEILSAYDSGAKIVKLCREMKR